MFCPNCKTEIDGDMRFCPSCGTPLTPPTPAVVVPAAPDESAPPAPVSEIPAVPVEPVPPAPVAEIPAAPAEPVPPAPVAEIPAVPAEPVPPAPVAEIPAAPAEPVPVVPAAVFCPNCGEKNDPQFAFCQRCGSPMQMPAPEQPEAGAKEPLPAKLKALWKKLPVKIAAIAAAAALVIVMVCIVNPFGSKVKTGVAYLKDNEISFTYLNKIKPFEATGSLFDGSSSSSVLYRVQFDESGTRMFYPDRMGSGGYALYYRDLKKDNTKADTAVKLDSDLQEGYTITKDGKRVFYLKGSEDNLYYHNLKDKEKIASDVESYAVSDDGKTLVYITEGDLYRKAVGSKKEAEKIDSEVSNIYTSSDLKWIYYLKDGSLYLKNQNKDKVKVDADVTKLFMNDTGTVYYLKEATEEIALGNYVTDDLKDSDAAITEPDITAYQTTVENEWWGPTTQTDWDAYNTAKDAYNKKKTRDRLREQLESEKVAQTNKTLYFFDGSKSTAISTDIQDLTIYARKSAVALYTKFSRANVDKVNLSDITSVQDIKRKVQAATTVSSDVYVALKEKEELLEASSPSSYQFNFSETKLYFLDDYSEADEYGTLMEVDVSGGKLGTPVKVDDDVSLITFRSGSDHLLYFKDVKNSSGDLYENGKAIATDVYAYSLVSLPKSKVLVYLVDYSSSSRTGALTIHTGKAKKIADDVADFVVEGEKSIAYITDWSKDKSRGDAYLYKGSSKPVKIDTDVSALVGVQQRIRTF